MYMTAMIKLDENTAEAETRIQVCLERRSRNLDLSDMGLVVVPETIKELAYLEVLKLSDNNLARLPDHIGSFRCLKYLDLRYNRLTVLPEAIGDLTALEHLNVRGNELSVIPQSIGKMGLLSFLDLSYNRLSQLPETINELRHLAHCNIKGNNLQVVSEKIAGLNESKRLSILGHIEQVVELTGKNGLSEDFCASAKPHIDYIIKKLRITPVQAVLFAHVLSEFENDVVHLQEIANSLNCSRIRLMQHMDDFGELERKKLIRASKPSHHSRGWISNCDTAVYSIPRGVISSLMKNEKYRPANQSNLSAQELFVRMESLFEQCIGDKEISYDELCSEITELLDSNKPLLFVKRIYEYKLSQDDFMMLLRFCHHYVNLNHTEMKLWEIADMFDHHSQFSPYQREMKCGEHILITRSLIENANSDGFGNRESFKLTETARQHLLTDLCIKPSYNRKDIIRSQSIREKKMFYNKKESVLICRFASLLAENIFREIQTRLSENSMRTGFACLFSGEPGTGKTETVYQIARETGRDIMMVDIAQSKSMWFGESEKKIKEIFTRYRDFVEESEVVPILFFNEADAIIGKRKDVSSSSVVQTENTIQNILLQELENLNGILIATTNMTENMDKAFERRFLYKVAFSKPDCSVRQSIWQSMMPTLSDNEAGELASRFDFSGGQIENIARKRTVEFVLSGEEPNLDTLASFCRDELLARESTKRIGFAL
jgi:hypothetical protein